MSLLDEILLLGIPLDDHGALAAALSIGRVRVVPCEIGKGRILGVLGMEAGNALLDAIDSIPDFRHVKQLVANGWLDVGDPTTRAMIDSLVGSLLTQEQAASLKALAESPDVITSQQVTKALEGYDGNI